MNQVVAKGIVLSRINFGEADRIITVITKDHGKLRLMVKGARKIKSKLAGGIELFSISDITFIPGRGEINTLTSARLITHYANIAKNIDRTMYGYEVLKIINKSTEDMVDGEYFILLATVLAALDDSSVTLESLRLWFNMQLLKLSGHSPNLTTDIGGRKLTLKQSYGFSVDDMAFIEHGSYGANHIKLLRLALKLDSPLRLAQVRDIDEIMPECLNLVMTMLVQFKHG